MLNFATKIGKKARQDKQSEPFTKKIGQYIFLRTRKALYLQSEKKRTDCKIIKSYEKNDKI
jgi:hypothetical protein